jgi:TonB-linked SusC/RagA family outer membrane protein
MAQSRTITGKVTDESGNPIPNASVIIKGTSNGTVTNSEGNYSLTVPASSKTLVISSVNMEEQEIKIGSGTVMNISLRNGNNSLQEVVVVGYGTKSIRENTSSISKVSGDKIAIIPLPSFDQALAGKTAGVQINATGGVLGDGVAIRVRGVNSINSNSQPLIVVDGIPQNTVSNVNGFNSGNGTRFNPLALINPNDIESIEVLKDAGASVIYGSRASNGVILITTKKGKKGTAKINADVKIGWANPTKLPELLNGDDFITIQNEKASNRYGAASPNAVVAKESDLDGDGKNDRTDWMDLIYNTAMLQDYTVNMSGGSDKASYYASARYLEQEGISYGNKLTTGQGRVNLDITPKTWFKSGLELAFTKTLNKGVLTDRYLAGSVTSGWQAPPTLAVYNPNGPRGYNLTQAPQSPIGLLGWGNNTRTIGSTLIFPQNFYNPIASVDLGRNDNTAEDIRANVYGEATLIKGLKFTSRFGIQYFRNFEDQFNSQFTAGLGQPYGALVQDQEQQWKLWDWQNYLSFDKTIAQQHKIGFVGGMEYQHNDFVSLYTGAANFADPFFQYIIDNTYTNVQPGTTTTLNNTGGGKTSSGIESYFGRLNYAFNGKYFIEGSFRGDSYSGFGINNRWGYFPSVSAGWEVTKEEFLSGLAFLNYLKVRGSYGKVGNFGGGTAGTGREYASRTLYGGAAYTISTGIGNTQLGNPNIQWESSKKLDFGFDAQFLGGQLGLTFDYFNNNIDNLILEAPVLYTVGIPNASILTNIGGMYNRGVEVTINATPVTSRDFRWTTSFNFTAIKNRVTGLIPGSTTDVTSTNSTLPRASLDRPLGVFLLPNWAGVDPNTGNPQWYAKDGSIKRFNFGTTSGTWTDANGNPVAALGSDDYVYQEGKTGLPTWYGGWDNTFSYKNFDLGISIMYQGGNYLYNSTRATLLTNFFSNNLAEIKNRWQKAGDVTDIPKLWILDNTSTNASSRFLEKADFLRVRTVSLSYNVQKSLLDKIGIDALRVYAQVFNALTITGYSGADPEVNTNRTDNIALGIDSRNVPQSRTITLGIQLGL